MPEFVTETGRDGNRLNHSCVGIFRPLQGQIPDSSGFCPAQLAEAEKLAHQYEYNDHLASIRLTQGHIAWDGYIPEWDKGFEAVLRYYQHALVYALRYNRFLLDGDRLTLCGGL